MTLEEFEAGLDRWGAELDDWPPPTRQLAASFLAESPAARREWTAMLEAERSLARTSRPSLPAAVLLAQATSRPQHRLVGLAWRLRYAACAAVVLAGLVHGALSSGSAAAAEAPEVWFAAIVPPTEPLDVE